MQLHHGAAMERTYTERKFWDGFAGRYDSFIKRLQPTYDLIIQGQGNH